MTQCLLCLQTYTRTSNRQKWCEPCKPSARRNYQVAYIEANKEQVLATSRRVAKEFRLKHPTRKAEMDKKWRDANKEAINAKRRTPEYRAMVSERQRARYAANASLRVHNRMSSAIYQALKEHKAGRKWEALAGYTLADLVRHMERQFVRGMSWENMGQWHIDHIRPKSGFDQTDPVQFRECWGLANLRPLWAPANQAKAAKREHLL